ncbi:hypothetical protein [Legionella longbeachae]|nr:hypothetical protein [Legionella longbeachae]VEE01602.1 Uncharacterised protein [Legionella oakridgensis]HBD7396363.1 hypothetical protein [Legionella pneumophila]ARB92052.1 hypothetical protein A6J40_07615 [Legionella longbeachae]ARM34765.1 hypothetical protein B0B39_15105 [Legionella longbeachae]EEZ95806.1 conserved hypothetical protein [Legionella longbeachae D-4968]
MKKNSFIFFLLLLSFSVTGKTSDFIVCKSKFALCTKASCNFIPGKKRWASCDCSVQEGYSLGKKPCTGVKNTSKGQIIKSRYYPVKTHAICKNNRPWAWCLDSSCIIDKKDPSKAECTCTVVHNKGPYVIVTDKYTKNTCTTGLYSSATVKGAEEITDFLKAHKELRPFPIKIINKQ